MVTYNVIFRYAAFVLSFFLLCFFTSVSLLLAQAEFDFDEDGLSDVVLVNIDSDGNLDWSYLSSRSSYSNSTSIAGGRNFGENGDNLVPGHWVSSSMPTIGFVTRMSGGIAWKIIDSGRERTLTFGKKGGYLVAGGDFDNNGITDAAYVKKNGNVTIKTNPFMGTSNEFTIKFTKRQRRRGKVLFLNADGSGDRIAILYRRNVRGIKRYSIVSQTLTRSKTNTRLVGVSRKGLKDVIAIKRPNGKDAILLFTRTNRGTFRVRIQDPLNGGIIFSDTFSGNSTIVVGDYNGADGEEFAIRDNSGALLVVNPWTTPATSFRAKNQQGVVADIMNVNTFANSAGGGGGPGSGGGNSGGGGGGTDVGGPAPRACGRTVDPRDGFKIGNVYKMSDHGGTPVFITHNGARSGNAITRDGQLLERLRYTGLANADNKGLRHHYRMSRSCSSLPSVFYLQIGGICYVINDRCGRID